MATKEEIPQHIVNQFFQYCEEDYLKNLKKDEGEKEDYKRISSLLSSYPQLIRAKHREFEDFIGLHFAAKNGKIKLCGLFVKNRVDRHVIS
eukprot:TRINITY_DN742_c0_g1_i7.p1 TRINITY_DN742_c0_g1~~TRINITY_DN742_c0_g1_i7.p1  ORF type:complete len:103 (-),score=21.07 TRINITY_DN742_c0_g1_i7:23-295(-)